MRGHGSQYERKRDAVIAALLDTSNKTIEDAARAAGVGVATLYRWQRMPDFQERLRAARQELVTQAFAKALPLLPKMIEVAHDIAVDESKPGTARVSAIRVIGEYAKLAQDADLTERMNQLERLVRGDLEPVEDTGDDYEAETQ